MYSDDVNSPTMIMTRVIVLAEIKPIIVPIVLLPGCSDVARVGKSPSLLGVAMAPTWPFRVAETACRTDIFSMPITAYFHFIASDRMLKGISTIQISR